MRKSRIVALFLVLGMVIGAGAAGAADKMTFFRIGTGGTAGTYYPIGGIIANAISNPPGSRPCDQGGSCGVPGLVAIAQSANGSVANVNAIKSGALEAGLPSRMWPTGPTPEPGFTKARAKSRICARLPTFTPKAFTLSPAKVPESNRLPI